MSPNWKWTNIDLADFPSGMFTDAPALPGIYLWRLRYGVDLDASLPIQEFLRLLQLQLDRPSGLMLSSQIGTTLRIGEMAIGGGKLSEEKLDFLGQQFGTPAARRLITSFFQSMDRFSPVIYVGKSINLKERISQHQGGQTDLKDYVFKSLGRQWEDLCLSYLVLPDDLKSDMNRADKLLGTLEMITQLALAPHGVKRRG
jgi:hypothetical protein